MTPVLMHVPDANGSSVNFDAFMTATPTEMDSGICSTRVSGRCDAGYDAPAANPTPIRPETMTWWWGRTGPGFWAGSSGMEGRRRGRCWSLMLKTTRDWRTPILKKFKDRVCVETVDARDWLQLVVGQLPER